MIKIGIVATSSVIPKIEFDLGVEHLRSSGFQVEVHPTVLDEYYFYPARDELRARALIEFSERPDLDVIWCGRGGYGATHLLPYLNRWKKQKSKKRVKKKVLLGFSDITALLEWYRVNLGWTTLHAPMPSLRTFSLLQESEWSGLMNLIASSLGHEKWKPLTYRLKPLFVPKNFKSASAPLVGGNLAVWNSLLGTPDQGNARGKLLFLEEIQENLGRINRMIHHLDQAGGLRGCKGIILGDFTDCKDSVPTGLMRRPLPANLKAELQAPAPEALAPLRESYPSETGLDFIFRALGERLNLPIYWGMPAGHGSNHHTLAFGKTYQLERSGTFRGRA